MSEARQVFMDNLLKARGHLDSAMSIMRINSMRPGGGSISDLGSMEGDLKEMLAMVEKMTEARER